MRAVSTLWDQAIRTPHGVCTEVRPIVDGIDQGPIPWVDGTITIDAGARYRRSLDLSVDASLAPTGPGDLLSPFGSVLWVRQGVVYPDGEREWLSTFRGPITSAEDHTDLDQAVKVAAVDATQYVVDARFTLPRTATAGLDTLDMIATLIGEAYPEPVTVATSGRNGIIPAGLVWDRDRDKAIDDLTRTLGAAWWPDPDLSDTGLPWWHVAPVPTLADGPVWTIDTGETGVLVSASRTQTRDGIYNGVVALSERQDGTPPIRALVTDTDPNSPTRWGGPFGKKPRFYSSPLLASTDQASHAAASLLAQSTGATRQRDISCVPNPALDAGDVIAVVIDGRAERHIVDTITLPLGVASAMQVQTRSQTTTGDIDEGTVNAA